MNDQHFLEQFENCSLPQEQFRHRNHLRLAWIYLSRFPLEEARLKLTQAIVRYATHLGATQIYNETLTCAWLYLVQQARQEPTPDFDVFIKKNNYLLDKDLPLQYYSRERLESEAARKQYLEPDLKPFSCLKQ
jgi:hypothetical protein